MRSPFPGEEGAPDGKVANHLGAALGTSAPATGAQQSDTPLRVEDCWGQPRPTTD